jgi:hypothetical protein
MADETTTEGQQPTAPAAPRTFEGSIFDYLPEDVRSNPALAKTGGKLDVLVGSYLAAQQYIGKDVNRLVELPDDPAAEGADATFKTILGKFGLPETLETYEIAAPEKAPASLALDTPMGQEFKKVAHEAGLLPKQASALYQWLAGSLGAAEEASSRATEAARADARQALQKEWGEAFNHRLYAAQDAAQRLGGDELVQLLEKAGVADHPLVLKAFAEMGGILGTKAVGPDGRAPAGAFGKETPQELTALAQEKLAAAHRVMDTDRMAAMKLSDEAQRLFARARGEAA